MIRSPKRLFAIGVVSIMTAISSSSAEACAVCFGGENDNRWAFIATTAFLTFLPLMVIAGGVVWFRKRLAEHSESAER